MTLVRFSFAICLSIFAGISVLAQESKPPAQTASNVDRAQLNLPRLLQTITVTATRDPEEIKQVPAAVTILSREAIEQRQAQTPNQMLAEEPGIWTPRTAAQGSPTIRGQMGNRILYLWDGIRINNGAIPSGPNGFFNQIPMNAVDRMDVVRGPGAVQYGSDAIGGVINILTNGMTPDWKLKKTVFGGDFTSRYGTVDREKSSQGNFWMTSRRFSFNGGATGQFIDDYKTPKGVMRNTGFKNAGGSLAFAFSPTEHQTLRFSWLHGHRFDVETYSQSKLNAGGIPRIFGPYEVRGVVKLTYDLSDLGKFSTNLTSYVYHQYYDARRDQTVESNPQINVTRTDTIQGINGAGVQSTKLVSRHRVVYGADYRSEALNSNRTLRTTTKSTGAFGVTIPNGNVPAGTYKVADAFVLTQIRPAANITLSIGTRLESTQLQSFPRPQDPIAPFTIKDLRLEKRWNSVTWNAGATYNVTHELGFAANVASGYRAPTFSDTLSTGVPVFASGVASVPSPNLKPERSVTYEAGPRYASRNLHLTLTAYHTQLIDNLFSVPAGMINIPGVGVVQALSKQNVASAYVRGVEGAAAYRINATWMLSANATTTRGQDTYQNVPLRFVPPTFGTLGLRWQRPGSRFSEETTMLFVDRLRRHSPDDERDAGFSTDPGFGSPSAANPPLRANYQIPGYAITNVRVGYSAWKTDRGEFHLFANINNLFNVRYREAYSQQEFLAAGAGAVIGARLRF